MLFHRPSAEMCDYTASETETCDIACLTAMRTSVRGTDVCAVCVCVWSVCGVVTAHDAQDAKPVKKGERGRHVGRLARHSF